MTPGPSLAFANSRPGCQQSQRGSRQGFWTGLMSIARPFACGESCHRGVDLAGLAAVEGGRVVRLEAAEDLASVTFHRFHPLDGEALLE